jgi:hypothetical protein
MPGLFDRLAAGRGKVDFAKTLVTGITRPLTRKEDDRVYSFEKHASSCYSCYNPYRIYRKGGKLCSKGHGLAVEVADLLFKLHSDGTVSKHSRSEYQEIQVEIPKDYENVFGLLKALEHSGKGFLKRPVSYDRTYVVQPRPPRSSSVPDKRRYSHHSDQHHRDHQPVIIEPNSRRKSSKHYRGSLYNSDRVDQERRDRRERSTRYEDSRLSSLDDWNYSRYYR